MARLLGEQALIPDRSRGRLHYCLELSIVKGVTSVLSLPAPSRADSVGVPVLERPRPERGVARTISGSFRLVIIGGMIITVLLSSLLAWIVLVSRPSLDRVEGAIAALQRQRAAMLDQETGVRGFLLGHQQAYLQPYFAGKSAVAEADSRILGAATNSALTAAIVDLRIAEQRWEDQWATPAAGGQLTGSSTEVQVSFLAQGKNLFDNYRVTSATATQLAMTWQDGLRSRQDAVIGLTTAAAALVAALNVAASTQLRLRLQRKILGPVDELLGAMAAVKQGRLEGRLVSGGPAELAQVMTGFNEMSEALSLAYAGIRHNEQQVADQAARLSSVLSMVREIGGSLNSGYVLDAIASGVVSMSQARRVVVWLESDIGERSGSGLGSKAGADTNGGPGNGGPDRDRGPGNGGPDRNRGRELTRAWQSVDTDGGPLEMDTSPPGSHVITAAKFGRSTSGHSGEDALDRLAVPLIVGARVIGALELILGSGRFMTAELTEVIETLSIHAATAIEATRLHAGAAHASEHDALTGLANRRRLETELDAECARSLRYGNPLCFIMLDLDHFKRLNDSFGHQRGDEVLQGCAQAICDALRATDTAYRYGGEELAVLARETTLEGGLLLAERLRAAIELSYPAGSQAAFVTASFGVAEMPHHAVSARELIATADAGLYAAKAAGRNCVVAIDVDQRPVRRS